MEKTYKFSQELVSQLAYIIGEYASDIESAERWSQDRDESYEWRHVIDTIAHLAWCPFRRKFLEGKPIEITFELKQWKQIRKVLVAKYKEKLHPLYTKMYPEDIKKLKKGNLGYIAPDKVAQCIIDLENKITKEQERWTKKHELLKQLLEIIK